MRHAHVPENWREIHTTQRDKGIRKRTFTVLSDAKVEGKSKGETVELEFTEEVIDHLINAGFIQEQGATPADEDPTEASATPPKTRATRARSNQKG